MNEEPESKSPLWSPRYFITILCLILAACVMMTGNNGWGWLIFFALIINM